MSATIRRSIGPLELPVRGPTYTGRVTAFASTRREILDFEWSALYGDVDAFDLDDGRLPLSQGVNDVDLGHRI
jgi:hypothetical protein